MKQLLFSLLVLLCCSLKAFPSMEPPLNDNDSTKNDTLKAVMFFMNSSLYSDSVFLDSSFLGLKNYNQIFNYQTIYTGNAGGARYSPVNLYTNRIQPSIINGFDSYLLNSNTVSYFRTNNPYSEVTYINGGAREEFFNLLHTQNFGEALNIKLDLTKQGSEGFYNHQRTNHTFFNFTTNFKTRHNVYGFNGHFISNRIKAEENGGFQSFNDIANPELTGTSNLNNAINTYKNNQYYLRQYVRIGKMKREYDEDSVLIKNFKPILELAYAFKYAKTIRFFEDDQLNLNYYPNTFYNNSTTFDSIFQRNYENEFTLSLLRNKEAFVGVLAGHEYFHHHQTIIIDTSFNNLKAGGLLHIAFKRFKWSSIAAFYLEGYNANDFYLQSNIRSVKKADSVINQINYLIEFDVENREVDYFLKRYNSNNFRWNNDFNKIQKMAIHATMNWYDYFLDLNLINQNGLIYFNELIQPTQANQNIQTINVTGRKLLNFGKFHLENSLTYQLISNEEILPLPDFVAKETFYYQNWIFNKALLTRIGFSLFYYSKHYGRSYMPVISQFYLQDRSNQVSLGNYPMFDVFVDMKVKRMKLFFMLSHVNEGLSGDNYYRIAGYPLPPRAFKFGLNWNFLN